MAKHRSLMFSLLFLQMCGHQSFCMESGGRPPSAEKGKSPASSFSAGSTPNNQESLWDLYNFHASRQQQQMPASNTAMTSPHSSSSIVFSENELPNINSGHKLHSEVHQNGSDPVPKQQNEEEFDDHWIDRVWTGMDLDDRSEDWLKTLVADYTDGSGAVATTGGPLANHQQQGIQKYPFLFGYL